MEVLDPYDTESKINQGIKNEKTNKENLEKADFLLNNYVLKHHQCPSTASYKIIIRNDIPKQKNGWDCGVFLLVFMKYLALQKDFNFDTFHMQFFRKWIKKELELVTVLVDFSLPSNVNDTEDQNRGESPNITKHNTNDQMEYEEIRGRERRPPLFENRSNTICWLNSLIQLLLPTIQDFPLNTQLRQIICSFEGAKGVQSCEELRIFLSQNMPMLREGQQDSFDFFQALVHLSPLEAQSVLHPMSLYFKNVVSCNNNPIHQSSSYQPDPECYISVNVPRDNTSMQDIIENEFHEGISINDWKCS